MIMTVMMVMIAVMMTGMVLMLGEEVKATCLNILFIHTTL